MANEQVAVEYPHCGHDALRARATDGLCVAGSCNCQHAAWNAQAQVATDEGEFMRISFTRVRDAVLNYALDEKRATGWSGGLWEDSTELENLIRAWGRQQERKGYLRALGERLKESR